MNKLEKDYGVFADYGYVTETILFETDSVNQAINWAERYTQFGDFGGWAVIEVGWFDAKGVYQTAWSKHDQNENLYDEA